MMIRILIALLSVFLFTACGAYYQKKFDEVTLPPNSDQNGKPSTGIAFDVVKKNILEPSCIKCHQNYSFYDSVKQDIDKIVQNVETDRMPKNSSPLSAAQKKLLSDWVADGAQDKVANVDPAKPTEPKPEDMLAPNWASLSRKVFFARCTTCHSPNGEAKFLDLSSRQAVFESYNRMYEGKPLLNFEKPSESYLLDVIQDPDEPMPPKKSKLEPLTQAEIDVLTEWIRLGLP